MQSVANTSRSVLTSFLAAANAQYREAGLGQYQMRVARDGSVSMPHRPRPTFKAPSAGGDAASAQASDGAAATAEAIKRSGAAPTVRGAATADGFQLQWSGIQGAKDYGIWQDGVLIGHVPKPSFIGKLAAGAAGVIQIDARRADGTRSELSTPLRTVRGADGRVELQEPSATSATPAPASTPASTSSSTPASASDPTSTPTADPASATAPAAPAG